MFEEELEFAGDLAGAGGVIAHSRFGTDQKVKQ
jgi:hypothetical protein